MRLNIPLLKLVFREPDVDHSYEDGRNCKGNQKFFVHTGVEVAVMTSMTKGGCWGYRR